MKSVTYVDEGEDGTLDKVIATMDRKVAEYEAKKKLVAAVEAAKPPGKKKT